jgi:hypothetical protein
MKKKFFVLLGLSILLALFFVGCNHDSMVTEAGWKTLAAIETANATAASAATATVGTITGSSVAVSSTNLPGTVLYRVQQATSSGGTYADVAFGFTSPIDVSTIPGNWYRVIATSVTSGASVTSSAKQN